jgi:small subunit ribosomal protein S21
MAKLVSVKLKKGENFNKLLSRFKRKVRKSEHLIEYRNRQEFLKPSVVKRRQKQIAVHEQRKQTILDKIESGDKSVKLPTSKRKVKKVKTKEDKK